MSLFTAVGQEAKKSANKKGVDLKTAYIRLKENEAVRVRLLGVTDYVEYKAHGDFNLGIFTQPCIEPTGQECPMCIAANSGIEGFDRLKAKKRYIFAFYDIDMKQIRFWDASKSQATKMIAQIEEYADSINEIAFTFKRTGTKTETSYNLMPILKLDAAGKEGFESANGLKVEMSHFEDVLIPRTPEQMIEALEKAGFPVADFFGTTAKDVDVEPTNVEAEENPLDVM